MRDILIVDDDPIIREGLARMIGPFEGHHAIHQAENGLTALEILCTGCIGIVFSDIKMPVMDGLEMLERLRELSFRGEVILVTGYDDFEFVRKAMRLGAADYLLKPILTEELRAVYDRSMARLRAREREHTQQRNLPAAILESVFTEQAWLDRLLDRPEEADLLLGAQGVSGASRVLSAVVDPFDRQEVSERSRRMAYLLGAALLEAIKAPVFLLQGVYRGLWAMVLVLPAEAEAPGLRERVEAFLRRENVRYGLCDPQPGHTVAALHEALGSAATRLESCFYDLAPLAGHAGQETPEALVERVADRIAARDGQGADREIRRLFDCLCEARPPVEQARSHLASVVYTLMRKNKDYIGIIGRYKLTEMDLAQAVREAATISALKTRYLSLVKAYIDALDQRVLSRDSYAIQRAKTYIEGSYQGTVSLSELADRLGLHPNYLSTLFHQKTGQTFSEYARRVRIERAIDMMMSTNLKVFEIAYQVGYGDSAQFHRAFKQVTGVSPGAYRRRHLPE